MIQQRRPQHKAPSNGRLCTRCDRRRVGCASNDPTTDTICYQLKDANALSPTRPPFFFAPCRRLSNFATKTLSSWVEIDSSPFSSILAHISLTFTKQQENIINPVFHNTPVAHLFHPTSSRVKYSFNCPKPSFISSNVRTPSLSYQIDESRTTSLPFSYFTAQLRRHLPCPTQRKHRGSGSCYQ